MARCSQCGGPLSSGSCSLKFCTRSGLVGLDDNRRTPATIERDRDLVGTDRRLALQRAAPAQRSAAGAHRWMGQRLDELPIEELFEIIKVLDETLDIYRKPPLAAVIAKAGKPAPAKLEPPNRITIKPAEETKA